MECCVNMHHDEFPKNTNQIDSLLRRFKRLRFIPSLTKSVEGKVQIIRKEDTQYGCRRSKRDRACTYFGCHAAFDQAAGMPNIFGCLLDLLRSKSSFHLNYCGNTFSRKYLGTTTYK